jgi:hypothetical protein
MVLGESVENSGELLIDLSPRLCTWPKATLVAITGGDNQRINKAQEKLATISSSRSNLKLCNNY